MLTRATWCYFLRTFFSRWRWDVCEEWYVSVNGNQNDCQPFLFRRFPAERLALLSLSLSGSSHRLFWFIDQTNFTESFIYETKTLSIKWLQLNSLWLSTLSEFPLQHLSTGPASFARCFTFSGSHQERPEHWLSYRRQTKLQGKTRLLFDNGASFSTFVLFSDTRARLLRDF